MSGERSILLISGAPASGKSTVALALAEMLGFALLSKDTVKEALFDSLGDIASRQLDSPAAVSSLLSRTAIDLLWALAPHCPAAILEANFRSKSEHERAQFAALEGRKLEIYCHCSPEEAARRFRERAAGKRDHPAHSMKTISVEALAEYDRPFGLCPVIDVDTEQPVNVAEIVGRIHRYWPDL